MFFLRANGMVPGKPPAPPAMLGIPAGAPRGLTMPVEQRDSDLHLNTMKHPTRPYKVEGCDNLAYYCFKAYTTGRLCARHVDNNQFFYKYQMFDSYCAMDYMNCSEGFEVWHVAHMGDCLPEHATYYRAKRFEYYEYWDDMFMDQIYVMNE